MTRILTKNGSYFPKGFMIPGGFVLRQVKKIDNAVKINLDYYQKNILTPIFKDEIPTKICAIKLFSTATSQNVIC